MTNYIIVILIVVYFFVGMFAFRFQRTTLSISRAMINFGNPDLQALMTPDWIGLLGWLDTVLGIGIVVIIFLKFNWIYALVFILLALFGITFIDTITPFPSYKLCFGIIKNSLGKDIKATKDKEARKQLELLAIEVIKIEAKYIK